MTGGCILRLFFDDLLTNGVGLDEKMDEKLMNRGRNIY